MKKMSLPYPLFLVCGWIINFVLIPHPLDAKLNIRPLALEDLRPEPEESNNLGDPQHSEALPLEHERHRIRNGQAKMPTRSWKPSMAHTIQLKVTPEHQKLGQTIEGFGGSIAFWGTNPDDQAMHHALNELNVSIVRAQGEVSPRGVSDHNREVLQRAMKINPQLQILLTFWQPRSLKLLKKSDWLDIIEGNQGNQYSLRKSMEDSWADEIVHRTKQYLDWGIRVTTLGVQNETNYSKVGGQTCIWDPYRLRDFIEQKLKPRLDRADIKVKIAAPDLAFIGYKGSELSRFLPTIRSPAVDVVAYHMYDSYKEGMDGSIAVLTKNSRRIGQIREQEFPRKEFWMTETTGAQWNNDTWHTYGWTPGANEFDKAILAAQYAHMTLAEARANVFMWWGLIYSPAPEWKKNQKARQKHRDEGLVLVEQKVGPNGRQLFLEKTKKFYVFKQFSRFLAPGTKRIEINSPEPLWVSAYLNEEKKQGIIIAVNPGKQKVRLQLGLPNNHSTIEAFQTDNQLNCEPVHAMDPLPGKSVRTYLYFL